jgi:hypothetical protein
MDGASARSEHVWSVRRPRERSQRGRRLYLGDGERHHRRGLGERFRRRNGHGRSSRRKRLGHGERKHGKHKDRERLHRGHNGGLDGGAGSSTGSDASGSSSGAAISCPDALSSCNGVCVNEQTDTNNCGGCGLACSVPCTAGRCIIALASTQATPDGIAVDARSVYWRLGFADTIMKVPINGGGAIKLGSGGQGGGPGNIVLDATSVYWTSSGGVGNVRKVPIDGRAVITLAGGPDLYSDGIAVDAVSVYWTGVGLGNGISVMKVPLDGGTVVTLASGQGTQGSDFPIVTDGRSLYWPVDTCSSDGGSQLTRRMSTTGPWKPT